ncbi:MAG: flagellar biosynthesis protein FlhF [Gammaproteobacteria bacterium]|nr:flagellar biosynthesis protein FlhF [Gammaproteobacteria bacterium]
MRIQRFFAPNIRQAIRMVREEVGPDAVILSNTKVEGGVEIIAAVGYDEALLQRGEAGSTPSTAPAGPPKPVAASAQIEWSQEPALLEMQREMRSLRGLLEQQLSSLAWGDMARRNPVRARLLHSLRDTGFSPSLARQIANDAAQTADYESAWRQALAILAHRIEVTNDDILDRGGVVALIGPTGVGKTTTIAKLAARFVLRHGARHVALITTDSYRIGAHEQLRTYARILGIPVRMAENSEELRVALETFSDKRLVLVDSAGMSQRDLRLSEQLALLADGGERLGTYLVLSAAGQMSVALEAARAFQGARLRGCIITKLDEATSLGGLLSVVIQQKLPVAYVSDGQRVPEDLAVARAHSLVSSAVSLAARATRMLRSNNHGESPRRVASNVCV